MQYFIEQNLLFQICETKLFPRNALLRTEIEIEIVFFA